MSERNRKKLELALRLKQALEADLKRLGKYAPKEKEKMRTRYVPQRREKPVTLNFSNIKNLRDIDEQDYDAPDTDLAFAIKKAVSSANLELRLTLQVILNLIEGTCSEVNRQLEGVKDPRILYNLWECQLFEGKASIATAFSLVKEFAAHPLTLLYLAEVLFFAYESPRLAEKVLRVLSEITNDPRLGFLLATYRGERDKAAEQLAELMRTNRFKDAIPIYLLLHYAGHGDETKTQTLRKHIGEKKHSACAMGALVAERATWGEFELQHLQQLVEQFPYCKLINNVLAQGEAVCGEDFDLTGVDEPTRLKFQIAMAVNEGHHETVKELTSKLADMFGEFQLVVGLRNEEVERKGMPSREKLRQFAKINLNTGVNILQVLQRFAKERDEDFSKIDYELETPNIEFLRLVWGWRVCQKLY